MRVPHLEYHRANSLDEAFHFVERVGPQAKLLAGGTDLLVDLMAGRVTTDHVISISRVSELRGITADERQVRIGALTTITELDRHETIAAQLPPLRDATQVMAVPQVRNVATIGGNLASAVPCADLPPILTVLDACVELTSPAGRREIPVRHFFKGVRTTVRRHDELVSAIIVPKLKSRFGAAYVRFGLRAGNAIAVAAVAVGMKLSDDGQIEEPILVLGAVAPTPTVAEGACRLLQKASPNDDVFAQAAKAAMREARPISDVRGSAHYRRELVEVLTKRALRIAHHRAMQHEP